MNWGNLYEVEFEPLQMVMAPNIPAMAPVKVCATTAMEAIQKLTVQAIYPIASVKLIVSNIQW